MWPGWVFGQPDWKAGLGLDGGPNHRIAKLERGLPNQWEKGHQGQTACDTGQRLHGGGPGTLEQERTLGLVANLGPSQLLDGLGFAGVIGGSALWGLVPYLQVSRMVPVA